MGALAKVWVLQAPLKFDLDGNFTEQAKVKADEASAALCWRAPLSDDNGLPDAALREFYDVAEQHLVDLYEIEDNGAAYRGRAKGARRIQKCVKDLQRSESERKVSPVTRHWTALGRVTQELAAAAAVKKPPVRHGGFIKHLEKVAFALIPRFLQQGCTMFNDASMRLLLDEM